MDSTLSLISGFYSQILPENDKHSKVWLISLIMCSISLISISFLGIYALAIPIGLVIIFLVFYDSGFILAFYFFSVPLIMRFFFDLYTPIILVLAILIIGYWAVRRLLDFDSRMPISRILIIYPIVFMMSGILSGLDNGFTTAEIRTLLRLAIFFVFVYVIYDLVKPRNIVLIMVAMTIPLLISSFSLFKEYSQVHGFVSLLELYRVKPGGIFPSSNLLGHALVVNAPFWIALVIWHKVKTVKYVSLVVSCILAVAIIVTNARAAILGFAISMVMFFFWAKKLRYLVLLLTIVLILLITIPSIWIVMSFAFRFDIGTTSRDIVWANTVDMIKRNPLLGIGLGNYGSEYVRYFRTGFEYGFMKTVPNAHFFILGMIADLGIPGILLSIVLYIFPIREGFKALNKARTAQDKAIAYGLMGGVLALLGRSLFESGGIVGSGRPYPDILFWLLFCMLLKINATIGEPTTSIFHDTKRRY